MPWRKYCEVLEQYVRYAPDHLGEVAPFLILDSLSSTCHGRCHNTLKIVVKLQDEVVHVNKSIFIHSNGAVFPMALHVQVGEPGSEAWGELHDKKMKGASISSTHPSLFACFLRIAWNAPHGSHTHAIFCFPYTLERHDELCHTNQWRWDIAVPARQLTAFLIYSI